MTTRPSARPTSGRTRGGILTGLPGGGGLNIAYEAVDRHALGERSDHLALRWLGKAGAVRDFTFADLSTLTNRFANALGSLGVAKGDLVSVLAGRIPELYVSALGTLKNGSVFSPLFSAFGPEPIRTRLSIGRAKVFVTTQTLYERKVASLRETLPDLEHVILVGQEGAVTDVEGTLDYHRLMLAAADELTIEPTAPDDVALIHFTSGTTGKPEDGARARGRRRPPRHREARPRPPPRRRLLVHGGPRDG